MSLNLTPAPTLPSLSDPENFNPNALLLFQWLTGTLIDELEGAQAGDFFDILGTVSQSGGVPTGALMEYATNSNGSYLRLADGTQVCWRTTASTFDINQTAGAIYQSFVQTADFPIAFHSVPVGFGSVSSTINAWLQCRCANTTQWSFNGLAWASRTGDSAALFAIGRWF